MTSFHRPFAANQKAGPKPALHARLDTGDAAA